MKVGNAIKNNIVKIFLPLLLILFSCDKKREDNSQKIKKTSTIEKSIFDNMSLLPKETIAQKKQIAKVPTFNIDSTNSPENLIIIDNGFGGDESVLYFFKNKKFVNNLYLDFYLIGEWKFKNNIISVLYYKEVGKKGIGEPIKLEGAMPGNYRDRYESYEDYSININKSETYGWNEIKTSIKEKDDNYVLKSPNLSTDIYLPSAIMSEINK